ncbi:MAG: hypothetical protein QNJ97_25225 [Myxococcota bacterium]|nr:hypothetical protein [Myxococcota bacterium]
MASRLTTFAGRPAIRRLFLAVGLLLIGAGAVNILHFVYHAAQARFPDVVLQAPQNWKFIGLHAGTCLLGLVLLSLRIKRKQ